MSETSLDAKQIAAMFVAGARRLESQKEIINELNVFPVPDGDTGTNMTLTIVSAADDVSGLYSTGDISMESLCQAIGFLLDLVFETHTQFLAATKQVAKHGQVARGGNDQHFADTSQHQR